jgi:hypothetical protein
MPGGATGVLGWQPSSVAACSGLRGCGAARKAVRSFCRSFATLFHVAYGVGFLRAACLFRFGPMGEPRPPKRAGLAGAKDAQWRSGWGPRGERGLPLKAPSGERLNVAACLALVAHLRPLLPEFHDIGCDARMSGPVFRQHGVAGAGRSDCRRWSAGDPRAILAGCATGSRVRRFRARPAAAVTAPLTLWRSSSGEGSAPSGVPGRSVVPPGRGSLGHWAGEAVCRLPATAEVVRYPGRSPCWSRSRDVAAGPEDADRNSPTFSGPATRDSVDARVAESAP